MRKHRSFAEGSGTCEVDPLLTLPGGEERAKTLTKPPFV